MDYFSLSVARRRSRSAYEVLTMGLLCGQHGTWRCVRRRR